MFDSHHSPWNVAVCVSPSVVVPLLRGIAMVQLRGEIFHVIVQGHGGGGCSFSLESWAASCVRLMALCTFSYPNVMGVLSSLKAQHLSFRVHFFEADWQDCTTKHLLSLLPQSSLVCLIHGEPPDEYTLMT